MVSIIIVSYNSLNFLKLTIDKIISSTKYPYELIVIDNASGEKTREWLKNTRRYYQKYAKHYQIIFNRNNRGYSGACNQGIEAARGKYLVFMNNDLLVSKNWLTRLIPHLMKDPAAGLVAPLGKGIGGNQNYVYIYHDYGYPEPFNGCLDRFSDLLYDHYQGDYTETKFLIGCCLLVKKNVLEEVGFFDQKLFMSADDFDYSLRARQAGFRLYVAEDVFVHHFDHRSFASLPPAVSTGYKNQGWKAFEEKWAELLKKYSMNDLFYNQKKIYYNGNIRGHREQLI